MINASSSPTQPVHVCILTTSPSETSQSRNAALIAKRLLEARPNVVVDTIDLRETPLELYPTSSGSDLCNELVTRFNTADAWVLAGPVYNAGPAAHLINFLHYALGGDERSGRPFLTIAGTGGSGSVYAFDSLGERIRREVKGIEIGTPVMVIGNLENAEKRLTEMLSTLVSVAQASRS